jgi:hypothetical protein
VQGISDEDFCQPIFGANYLKGVVAPVPTRGLAAPSKFRLYFSQGGCTTFLNFFFKIMEKYKVADEMARTAFLESQRAVQSWVADQQAYVDPSDPSVIFVTQPAAVEAQPRLPRTAVSYAPVPLAPVAPFHSAAAGPSYGASCSAGGAAGPPVGYGAPPPAAAYGASAVSGGSGFAPHSAYSTTGGSAGSAGYGAPPPRFPGDAYPSVPPQGLAVAPAGAYGAPAAGYGAGGYPPAAAPPGGAAAPVYYMPPPVAPAAAPGPGYGYAGEGAMGPGRAGLAVASTQVVSGVGRMF